MLKLFKFILIENLLLFSLTFFQFIIQMIILNTKYHSINI
jgi:hypothetical protein